MELSITMKYLCITTPTLELELANSKVEISRQDILRALGSCDFMSGTLSSKPDGSSAKTIIGQVTHDRSSCCFSFSFLLGGCFFFFWGGECYFFFVMGGGE